jgi:hypothetical protein
MISSHNYNDGKRMNPEQEPRPAAPSSPQREERNVESLTDLIDRMDREAFRRALEQRDLRMMSSNVQRR